MSLTFVIPSAFVAMSVSSVNALSRRKRLGIISAGAFHNIALWCVLVLVRQTGFGSVVWGFGYWDLSDVGKVVLSVDTVRPD